MGNEGGVMRWFALLFVFSALRRVTSQVPVDQTTLDKLADSLQVKWQVVTNTDEVYRYDVRLTLTNTGNQTLPYGDWTLYWYSVYPAEPDHMDPGGSMTVKGQGLNLTHMGGMLYSFAPNADFRPLWPGDTRVLRLKIKYWSVARSDQFPNWYMTGSEGTEPRIIASTAGIDPIFNVKSRYPHQQKTFNDDYYYDRTPQIRYQRNYVPYASPDAELRVVPKPWKLTVLGGSDVSLMTWQVVDASSGAILTNEVDFIVDKLSQHGVTKATSSATLTTNVIILNTGNIVIADNDVRDDLNDTHSLEIDDHVIRITGQGPSGVFWGIQTLLSLLNDKNGTVPKVRVHDAPRFDFRGLFIDISRNFRGVTELEVLLDAMAMYKLNRLHLHLSDDEGWRIEIQGLPELTEMGSKRCHDLDESRCLLPQLGSGPFSDNSGSGFLTAADYRRLLTKASKLHIQVIPEIDLPGHARAAIKAMEVRYRNYMAQGNRAEAERYRLVDVNDTSKYVSPQIFTDNVINICTESAYNFIAKVVQEIKKLHEGIQELKEFHGGFDEVAGAWEESPDCARLKETDALANATLDGYFFMRYANITHSEGLAIGAWQDGLMIEGNTPFDRSLAKNEVYANVWENVWEWGSAAATYNLANQGYKVVMSHATSLFFDHPYEPHWEERGFYWATRFTDSQETFSFMPMDYYGNILERRSGKPLTREEICENDDVKCPPLEKPENIVGMQGQLWSETVRTIEQAQSQLFPRVLALAERAWHFAPWEQEQNATLRQPLMMKDWYSFARAVGYRELPRLDKMDVRYRVPPPGGIVEQGQVKVTGGYPGLAVEISDDWGQHWTTVDGRHTLDEHGRVWLRTRSSDGRRYSRAVELTASPGVPATPQTVVDYISENLHVEYEITDNYLRYGMSKFVATLYLTNTGTQPIPAGNWEILFPSVQWLEADPVMEGREFILQDHKMALTHVKGYLFRLSPLFDFPPFENGTTKEIEIRGNFWSVSKYEQFPNYIITADGANPRTINNTAGESMSFVRDFSKVNQWKRDSTDKFDPLTPSARFGKQSDTADMGSPTVPYLPTPLTHNMDRSKMVSLKSGWVIAAPSEWTGLALFLKGQLSSTDLSVQEMIPADRYIELRMSGEGVPDSKWPGAYTLTVNADKNRVIVVARNDTGALYGIQSLINMALQSQDQATVFQTETTDAPRFPFRGMYLDVARNFHSKDDVVRLLGVMGMYKLNRLHLHLGDDEGWRLEIPGLPELTTVGSTRCQDPTEERCLVPVLGSGPDPENSGSGYFTAKDYKEILQYAAQRHIQVIPEFDMPGHSRAAIVAMALRRRLKTEEGDIVGAHEFELDEEGDPSEYSSVQMFSDNAVNPCLESTYRFIRHVITEVKQMHDDVNPLMTYHFGGDEVAQGAWVDSKACSKYTYNNTDLKLMFSERVAAVAAEAGLDLGCWEDGIMTEGKPIPRKNMAASHVYANAWDNIWEWGKASRAYVLANAGYKVIMGQATHLYFDFPAEPDPNERGFYWAARTTDVRKVFLFQPQHLWNNVRMTRMGDPYTAQDVCGDDDSGCPQLVDTDNVVGMQGHLWSETVRTGDQVDYMIFPRLLALAERAWHTGQWEGREGKEEEQLRDWIQFANTLGHSQLAVLDRVGVQYRLCPPGVRQEGGQLKVNTEFPGLKTQYKTSGSETWNDVTNNQISAKEGQLVHVRTMSPDEQRFSRAVEVEGAKYDLTSGSGKPIFPVMFVFLVALAAVMAVM